MQRPPSLGLEGCELGRPVAFDAGVEVVSAAAVPRAFPTRVSEGLGICLKWGAKHDVMAEGRSLVYPADALCVRTPGCIWSSDAASVAFVSIDVATELLPGEVGPPAMRFRALEDRPGFARLVRDLAAEDALRREEALTELVLIALSGTLNPRMEPTRTERVVLRAQERLRSSLDENLTLAAVADELATNKFVLLRAFRKLTGTTPYRYRTLVRIAHAKELLARGASPAEVSAVLGFSDQAHLSRSFKRTYGVTPRAYGRIARH
jgi:AraC-like DNA-binding protein